MNDVRMPAVSGKFYPSDADELRKMITEYLDAASVPEMNAKLKGIIVPHAGYLYSGPVAAYGYKLLQNKEPDKIIILGPSHYAPFPGMAEGGYAGWSTPLGIAEAFSIGGLHVYPAVHQPEHSVEVQLPFLQTVLKNDFKVDPILTGMVSPAEGADVLEKQDAFFVISSDLSHYEPYSVAVERDRNTVGLIEKLDVDGFLAKGDACGKTGISIAMELAKRKGWMIEPLHYANSGDTAGPKTEVVGYAALAILEG